MTAQQVLDGNRFHTDFCLDCFNCSEPGTCAEATFCCPMFWCFILRDLGNARDHTFVYSDPSFKPDKTRAPTTCCDQSIFVMPMMVPFMCPFVPHWIMLELMKTGRFLEPDRNTEDGQLCYWFFPCGWPVILARYSRELHLRGYRDSSICYCREGTFMTELFPRNSFAAASGGVRWIVKAKPVFLIRRNSKGKFRPCFEIFGIAYLTFLFLPEKFDNSSQQQTNNDLDQILHGTQPSVLSPEHVMRLLPQMS